MARLMSYKICFEDLITGNKWEEECSHSNKEYAETRLKKWQEIIPDCKIYLKSTVVVPF